MAANSSAVAPSAVSTTVDATALNNVVVHFISGASFSQWTICDGNPPIACTKVPAAWKKLTVVTFNTATFPGAGCDLTALPQQSFLVGVHASDPRSPVVTLLFVSEEGGAVKPHVVRWAVSSEPRTFLALRAMVTRTTTSNADYTSSAGCGRLFILRRLSDVADMCEASVVAHAMAFRDHDTDRQLGALDAISSLDSSADEDLFGPLVLAAMVHATEAAAGGAGAGIAEAAGAGAPRLSPAAASVAAASAAGAPPVVGHKRGRPASAGSGASSGCAPPCPTTDDAGHGSGTAAAVGPAIGKAADKAADKAVGKATVQAVATAAGKAAAANAAGTARGGGRTTHKGGKAPTTAEADRAHDESDDDSDGPEEERRVAPSAAPTAEGVVFRATALALARAQVEAEVEERERKEKRLRSSEAGAASARGSAPAAPRAGPSWSPAPLPLASPGFATAPGNARAASHDGTSADAGAGDSDEEASMRSADGGGSGAGSAANPALAAAQRSVQTVFGVLHTSASCVCLPAGCGELSTAAYCAASAANWPCVLTSFVPDASGLAAWRRGLEAACVELRLSAELCACARGVCAALGAIPAADWTSAVVEAADYRSSLAATLNENPAAAAGIAALVWCHIRANSHRPDTAAALPRLMFNAATVAHVFGGDATPVAALGRDSSALVVAAQLGTAASSLQLGKDFIRMLRIHAPELEGAVQSFLNHVPAAGHGCRGSALGW